MGKNSIKILLFFFYQTTFSFSQSWSKDTVFYNSILSQTKLVNQIDKDSIATLMIIRDLAYGTKGFLVENNINREDSIKTSAVKKCDVDCDVRLEAYPISDSLFIIKFKYRESKDFIIDTGYLFKYDNNNYLFYPKGLYNDQIIKKTIFMWYGGPSSTDERDDIIICEGEEKKTVFCGM